MRHLFTLLILCIYLKSCQMCKESSPSVFLHDILNLSYVERLNVCNLEPLLSIKFKMDMLFVRQLLHGCVKCNLLDYVSVSTGVRNTKGNLFKLNKMHAKFIM